MKTGIQERLASLRERCGARTLAEVSIFCVLAGMTAVSAALTKEAQHLPALASVSQVGPAPAVRAAAFEQPLEQPKVVEPTPVETARAERMIEQISAETRWFNGRPVRPARVLWMQVTAYSPDWRSCGKWADGKTATLHSVQTNGGALVAADTRILPYGSMLSIEGYSDGEIVPVLDRGGAIKGYHIDLLMPTHRTALRWGNRRMPVVVWEFADGRPAVDPRKLR